MEQKSYLYIIARAKQIDKNNLQKKKLIPHMLGSEELFRLENQSIFSVEKLRIVNVKYENQKLNTKLVGMTFGLA